MINTIKKTAPNLSVGADKEQSPNFSNNIIASNTQNINSLSTISMTELLDNVYPPRIPIIENLLYGGTYLFVGAPKVGKSFFMGLLAHHVSTGTDLWGNKVNQGTVLYLALEDNYSRLQERFSKMFGTDSNDNLYFTTLSKNIGHGLETQLELFLKEHCHTKLIIIDTLQKVRESTVDGFSYANDYDIVTKLKNFSDKYNICILIVHHTRKQSSSDSFDTISGSNGLLGAADGAFVLKKERRTSDKAFLDISGRDQQDQKLHLEFNRNTLCWQLIKNETEIIKQDIDPILKNISKVVNDASPIWEGTSTALLEIIGEKNLLPNQLTRKLNVNVETLLREFNIIYENYRTHDEKIIKLSMQNI